MHSLVLILGLTLQPSAATVLDRIAVIVGKQAIKTSDINRDLRVTEFLNRSPLDLSPDAKRESADRLIDQRIIRDEISAGDYHRATDAEAEAMLNQIRRDRFAGSDPWMRAELLKYGVSTEELREALLWQLTVLRFIDDRFRPAVLVTDQDLHSYYDQHLAELKRQYPKDNSFDTLEPQLRTLLQSQQVDRQFEAWLDQARRDRSIEYRQGAFQ